MACSRGRPSRRVRWGRTRGGNIVTEDIAEFGVDGQFMVVKVGGFHGGWSSCRSCGSCRSVSRRCQELFDVAQEANIVRVATPEAAQHGRAGKVVNVVARGGGRAQEKRLGSRGERYASGTRLDSDIVLLQAVHAEQHIHAV
jgi:hypothetical protein